MRKKRFLSLALALAMLLSLCPITAMATDESDFDFSKGTITKYKGSGGRVEIPATIGGQAVTAIGDNAFNGNKDITEVVIPKGVITIGKYAFDGCGNLKSVVIPEGVTTIGGYAFFNCKALASVTIPKSVTTIGVEAFRDCTNLESVVIPKGVTTIGEQAFDNCNSLESVVIPESVTTIGKYAFRGNNFESVTFMGQPTTIGDNAFEDVSGDLILPADWKGDPEEGDGVKWKGGRFNVVKHTHSFTGNYVIGTGENAGKHGQKCECGEVGNWTAHTFTDGECVCGALEAYAINYNCVDQAGDPVMSSTGPTTYYTKDGIVFDESNFVPEAAFYKFVSIEPKSIAVGTKGDKDVTVTFEYAPELPTVSWSAPVNATVVAFDAEGLVFESGNKVPVGSEVKFTVEPAEGYEYGEAPKGWTLNEEYGTISGTVTVPDCDITVTIPEPTEKATTPFGGTGEADDPYRIASEGDLFYLADNLGTGNLATAYYRQTNDIEMSLPFPGIGTYAAIGGSASAFKGEYDGSGNKITNLVFANASGNQYRGLFNEIESATVKNLTVEAKGFESGVSGEYGAANIVGHAYHSTVQDCVATGAATYTHNGAGIVIRATDATIRNCTNKANITGSYTKVAGIVVLAQNDTQGTLIEGCLNEGTITANGDSSKAGRDGVAGIIAYASSANKVTVKDCTNKGEIVKGASASTSAKLGQIIGYVDANAKVESCTARDDTALIGGCKGTARATGADYAIHDGNTLTTVALIAAGGTYFVLTQGAAPVIELGEYESITFDQSLATIDEAGITAVTGCKIEKSEGNPTTYTAVSDIPTYAVTWDEATNATVTATVGGNPITSGDAFVTGTEVAFTVTPKDGYEYATAPEGWTLNVDGTITVTVKVDGCALTVVIPEPTEKQAPITVELGSNNCRVMALPYDTDYYPLRNLTVEGADEGLTSIALYKANGEQEEAYYYNEWEDLPAGWFDSIGYEDYGDWNLAEYDYFKLYTLNDVTFTFTNPNNVPQAGSEPYDFPLKVTEGNTVYTYHSKNWQPIEAVFALPGSIEKPVWADVFWLNANGAPDVHYGKIEPDDPNPFFAEGFAGLALPPDTAVFVHIHDWECTAEGHSCKNHDAKVNPDLFTYPMVLCPTTIQSGSVIGHTFGNDDICTVCGYERTYKVTWDEATNATVTAKVDGKPITSGEAFVSGTVVAFTVTPEEGYEYATAPEGWTLEEDGTITVTVKVPACDITVTIPEPMQPPITVEVDGCRVMALPYDTGYYPISNLTMDGNIEMGTVGAGSEGFIAYTADGSSVKAMYLIEDIIGLPDGWYDADLWEPIVDCNLAAYDYFMLYNGAEPITFTFTNPDNVPQLGSEPYDFPLEVTEGNTLYTYHSENWQPIEAVFDLSGSIEKPVRASVFWFDHAGHIDIDSCYSGEIRQAKDGSLVFAEGLLDVVLPPDTAIFVHIHDWDCTAEGHSCKNHDAENPTVLSSDPMVVCPVMVLRNFTGKHTFGDDDICTVCGYEKVIVATADGQEFASFNALLTYLNEKARGEVNVTLESDLVVEDSWLIGRDVVSSLTVDLNGHSLSPASTGVLFEWYGSAAALTVADSSETKSGSIVCGDNNYIFFVTYAGGAGGPVDVTINGGNFNCPAGCYFSDVDTVTISGGRFKSNPLDNCSVTIAFPEGKTLVEGIGEDAGWWILGEMPPTYEVMWNTEGANATVKAEVDGDEISSGEAFESGTVVTFTVTPEDGYEYDEAPEGWTLEEDGSITQTFTVGTEQLEVFIPAAEKKGPLPGRGTAEKPYLIASEADLAVLNENLDNAEFATAYFKQTNDIALTGAFDGIGQRGTKDTLGSDLAAYTEAKLFKGNYDGDGYTISGLVLKQDDYVGFFNSCYGATIRNLKISLGNETGWSDASSDQVGAVFIGVSVNTTLENCQTVVAGNNDTFKATKTAAGLIGFAAHGTVVKDCVNNLNIWSVGNEKAGGLIACAQAGKSTGNGVEIDGCTNNGYVKSKNDTQSFGGFVGYADLKVTFKGDNKELGTIDGKANFAYSLIRVNAGTVAVADGATFTVPAGFKTVPNGKAVDGLFFATVDGDVATLVKNDALAANGSYKVMATGAAPVIKLAEGESITFDQSLATMDEAGITAVAGCKIEKSEGNPTTYTAVSAIPTYKVTWDEATNATVTASVGGNTITSGDAFVSGTVVAFTVTPKDGYEYATAPEGWAKSGNSITGTFTVGGEELDVDIPEPTEKPDETKLIVRNQEAIFEGSTVNKDDQDKIVSELTEGYDKCENDADKQGLALVTELKKVEAVDGAVSSITYDVTPKDGEGKEVHEPEQPITFELPVTEGNFKDDSYVKVEHESGVEDQQDEEYYAKTSTKQKDGWLVRVVKTVLSYFSEVTFTVADGFKPVAQIGDGDTARYFATLEDAVKNARPGDTITLLDPDFESRIEGNGIFIDKPLTIDFGWNEYIISGDAVGGSETSKNQGFHIQYPDDKKEEYAGMGVTLKNGYLSVPESNMDEGKQYPVTRMLQNYVDLTMENMVITDENVQWREKGVHSDSDLAADTLVECDGGNCVFTDGYIQVSEVNRDKRYALAIDDWQAMSPTGTQVTLNGCQIFGKTRLYEEGEPEELKSALIVNNYDSWALCGAIVDDTNTERDAADKVDVVIHPAGHVKEEYVTVRTTDEQGKTVVEIIPDVTSCFASLTLSESLNLNFYVYFPEGTPAEEIAQYTVRSTFLDQKETMELLYWGTDKDGSLEYRAVVAKAYSYQMTEPVKIELFYDGSVIKSTNYSVQQYLETFAGKDDKMSNLATACLSYGGAAQRYFAGRSYVGGTYPTYTADQMADKNFQYGLESVEKPDAKATLTREIDGLSYSASMILGNELTMKIYLGTKAEGATITAVRHDKGTDETLDDPVLFKEQDGSYSFKVTGIRLIDLNKSYTMTITKGGKTDTLTYSPYTYLAQNWDGSMGELSKAMKAVGDESAKYFGY